MSLHINEFKEIINEFKEIISLNKLIVKLPMQKGNDSLKIKTGNNVNKISAHCYYCFFERMNFENKCCGLLFDIIIVYFY